MSANRTEKEIALSEKTEQLLGEYDSDLDFLTDALSSLQAKRDKEVNGHSVGQFIAFCRDGFKLLGISFNEQ